MDNYGRILLKETTAGEGGDRPSRLALSNYTSDRIVSKLVGPVALTDGVAEIEIPPLDFDGSVRLVAIGWTGDGVAADDEHARCRRFDRAAPRRAAASSPRATSRRCRSSSATASSARAPTRSTSKPPPGAAITGIADAAGNLAVPGGEAAASTSPWSAGRRR